VSACLCESTNESLKYVQTIPDVQNVRHVSTYSGSLYHTQALMITIVMPVFDEGFMEKPKHVAHFGR
jgi:hypothetical protein